LSNLVKKITFLLIFSKRGGIKGIDLKTGKISNHELGSISNYSISPSWLSIVSNGPGY
jgi:hypothetical protein